MNDRQDGGRRRSPFAAVVPASVIALAFGLATVVWIATGDRLPGGRWLAVHLFTLGVLTNVVVAYTQHFGRTITRSAATRWRWQPAVLNAGIVCVLAGIPTGATGATTVGATVVTAVVFDSYRRLRRMRRDAAGARFVWIARIYERAHGSFIHGAVLGLVLGIGLLRGPWYGAGRVAHLHVNILGWAGLTLLATLVFFGPTMVRARIEPGADDRGAVTLRRGAGAVTIAVVLLLATGIDGPAGATARVLAAGALGVFAWSVTVVCLPVLRVARAAKPSATRPPLIALCGWFPLVAWGDVAIVASGALQLLDALGMAMLAGVLGQAVITALGYIAPAIRGDSNGQRRLLTTRIARGATVRTVVYNAGVAVVATVAVGGTAFATSASIATPGSILTSAGWLLVVAAVVAQVAAALWPIDRRL